VGSNGGPRARKREKHKPNLSHHHHHHHNVRASPLFTAEEAHLAVVTVRVRP
jgi:hypothetical protein